MLKVPTKSCKGNKSGETDRCEFVSELFSDWDETELSVVFCNVFVL